MVQPTAAASTSPSDLSPAGDSSSGSAASPWNSTAPPPAIGSADRPIKKRQRATLSCTTCHARKQSCNRQVPCNRCIARGSADTCRIEGKKPSNGSDVAAPPPSSSKNHSSLLDRIAVLEAALQEAKAGQPSSARAIPTPNDVQDAATALGELAQSTGVAGEYSQWHGTGSVASLLKARDYAAVGPDAGGLGVRLRPDQITKLVSALPPRPLANFLVDRFWSEEINGLIRRYVITRRDTFERVYEQVMAYKDDLDLLAFQPALPTSLAALSMVSVVLATGLQFSDPSTDLIRQYCLDPVKLEEDLKDQARAALDLSEAEEPPSFFRVEATVWQAIYSKNSGRPNANFFLVARAIRTAQQMGMHREGADQWGLLPYEAEQRRRLWWMLYVYDKQSNYAYGRPSMINDLHCDTREPANADLRFWDETSTEPIISQPIEEPTPFTINLIEIRCAKLVSSVADRIFSPAKHTYADVVECDRQMVELETGLPLTFRSPSLDVIRRCPWIVQDFATMSMHMIWLRCLLHRPYLLKPIPSLPKDDYFAGSRQLAITLSQNIISVARNDAMRLTAAQTRFFMFPFRLFDAAANLALANLQLPTSASAVRTNDRWILEARTALASMGNSTIAGEAVRCLDALRQRVKAALPEGLELAGPIVDVGPGPHAIPYTGGTISFKSQAPPTAQLQQDFVLPESHYPPSAVPPLDLFSSFGGPQEVAGNSAVDEQWMNLEASPIETWPITAVALQGPDEWASIWATIQAGL